MFLQYAVGRIIYSIAFTKKKITNHLLYGLTVRTVHCSRPLPTLLCEWLENSFKTSLIDSSLKLFSCYLD
jgi:hypothetical protein